MEADAITWERFVLALAAYRDSEFLSRTPISGERAYLALVNELAGVPMAERHRYSESVVLFLNRWSCHFPGEESPAALASWLLRESSNLEALVGLSVLNFPVDYKTEFDRLHDSLIALRRGDPRIFTMSDACASKLLHQMIPPLFVMWDSRIRTGYGSYGAFMLDMRALAQRLEDDLAPAEARADIEGYLQDLLSYPIRKPLAKYIDHD